MRAYCRSILASVLLTIPASAATVTVEKLWLRTGAGGDPVPGRAAPVVFREITGTDNSSRPVMLPPVINNVGQVVFRARSASQFDNNALNAIGIYAKRPGFPLAVLADTTLTSGVPTFPVPGRPAGTVFSDFKAPLINDAGDVVFFARFSGAGGSGSGFYATHVTGGSIVKLADTFTVVPGYSTSTFRTFDFTISQLLTASLNNNGDVVYWGEFLIPPAIYPNVTNAIFGTSIVGGAGVLLADSTQTPTVNPPVGGPGGFREIRPTPVINNAGTVIFAGNLGPSPSFRNGIFAVPVTGGTVTTVAFRGQSVPGRSLAFSDTFDPAGYSFDVNDAGVVVFRNSPSGSEAGNYAATPAGSSYVLTRIIDTYGCTSGPCLPIPGETVPPAEYSGNSPPPLNESGQVGVYSSVINSPTPNQQGIFVTDIDGAPISIAANLLTPPPGLPAPVGGFPKFSNFFQEGAGINDFGHMSFVGGGSLTLSTGFTGLYFYDSCTPELVRLSDTTIALAQLGNSITTPPRTPYDIWQVESRSGHLKSIGNSNDVAFSVVFNNFDSGMYIAHVSVGGGGQLNITCPSDVTAQCPANTDPSATGTATATGCGTITVSHGDSTIAGCGASYTITRTWSASNGSTTTSCQQLINVADTTAPVLSGVPDQVSVECGVALPPPAAVTAYDGCQGNVSPVLSEWSSAGPCPGAYVLTRTWTATDGCGNATSASHQLWVLDTLAPTLMGVPGDVTVECNAVPTPPVVTGGDQCDPQVTVTFGEVRTDGRCPDNYVLTRSWTAADECGNDATASQLVTVQDTTPATVACPPHATLECPGDTSVASNGSASGSDACGATSISSSDATQTGCGATLTVTRTWTATDECGNASSCDQLVAVRDTTPPTVACPSNLTLECPGDTSVASNGSASGSDACGATSISSSDATQTGCGATLTVTRTWTATDECGNASSCDQLVAVRDTTPPTVACPSNVTLECPGDTSVASNGSASGSDACGATSISSSDATQTGCGATLTVTRTWTATDECGNASSCDQFVAVRDTTPPTIACPSNVTLECPGDTSIAANGSATGTDNCGTATISSSDLSVAGCGATVTLTRSWTAADQCGNASLCDQLLTVVDTTPPVLTVDTTPITVTDTDCSGSEIVSLPIATASDACSAQIRLEHNAPVCLPGAPPPGGEGDDGDDDRDEDNDLDDNDAVPVGGLCFPTGKTTVTFTATDACGNTASANVDVNVLFGANIEIRASRHTVGQGSHPHSTKEPLIGILVCAYDKSNASCAQTVCGGVSHHSYQCILDSCTAARCGTTDSNGGVTLNVPPGDYVVISGDATKTALPDPLGVSASDLGCGETMRKYLQQIVRADGEKKPGKCTRLTGSELLIIEPEYIIWDNMQQLYPFVFETIGDWTVTATVMPPAGFVADYDALSANVVNEVESVQFTITEVGSDLIPTQTTFDVLHKGERQTVHSSVDIRLTPEYARLRGFDVNKLRTKGLIVEPAQRRTGKVYRDRENSR